MGHAPEAERSPKGNGQHGSAANGAGSAVDGPPRTVRVEEIGSEHLGGEKGAGPRKRKSPAVARKSRTKGTEPNRHVRVSLTL